MNTMGPKIFFAHCTLDLLLQNVAGVPSNPKTSLDYMDGLFQDFPGAAEDFGENLSPTMLKKKIENLQSAGQQKR